MAGCLGEPFYCKWEGADAAALVLHGSLEAEEGEDCKSEEIVPFYVSTSV